MNKKIVIQGAYGDANIGDDLLLDMIIRLLKQKGFKSNNFVIAGNKATYLTEKFDKIKVVTTSSGKYVNCDYFILGGGTQFFSFKKVSIPKNKLKIYFNVIKADPFILIRFIRSKLGLNRESRKIALGIGLGPFLDSKVENNVRNRLLNFEEVVCRDFKSMEYCRKWGVNSTLSADLCLSDLYSQNYSQYHTLSKSPKKIIGVVIRDWIQNGNGDIINGKIFDLIKDNKCYTFKIFIFSRKKDAELVSRINQLETFQKENIHIWNPEKSTFKKYLKIFNLCDLVITSRYHAAIFALNYGIPTICLAIDPKLKFITEEVEGFSYCEIEDMENIPSQIETVFMNYNEIQSSIYLSYKALNIRANKVFELPINNN